MSYPFLIILAIIPSFIWLLFYLRKDANPESNSMILKIFIYGMLAAIPAVFIELGFFQMTAKLSLPSSAASLLNVFIGVALVEEFLKYLVVKEKILPSPELDEPLDAMLYLIIAALGFAAVENILKFLSPEIFNLGLAKTLIMAGFILVSSTLLHALASGLLGFFLALGLFESKKRFRYFAAGLLLASLLHGIYNFYIIKEAGILRFLVPVAIIAGLAVFVSFGLKRLKKMPSICKI